MKAITTNNLCSKVKDSYELGLCPDCCETIPEGVVEGESCNNCEHVFYEYKAINEDL